MSLWRKKAFEQLPELGTPLQEEDNMYSFLNDLFDSLEKATKDKKDDLIKRIYDYALWCLEEAPRGKTAEDDIFTAIIVCFFENIPLSPHIYQESYKWIPRNWFVDMKEPFLYHGSESDYQKILIQYNHKK